MADAHCRPYVQAIKSQRSSPTLVPGHYLMSMAWCMTLHAPFWPATQEKSVSNIYHQEVRKVLCNTMQTPKQDCSGPLCTCAALPLAELNHAILLRHYYCRMSGMHQAATMLLHLASYAALVNTSQRKKRSLSTSSNLIALILTLPALRSHTCTAG